MLTNQIREYPIEHWSYSSLLKFLSDRYAFKKQYILKIYDDKTTPSALVGTAAHKALEAFYKGHKLEDAIQEGQRYIDTYNDQLVDYGKTGSREKVIKDYTQAVNFYFAERPECKEIIGVEEAIVTWVDINGTRLALPIKAKIDLITRDADGKIVVRDHKFVTSYSDKKKDKGDRTIQAMFYYFAVKEKYKEAPHRMIFDEVKVSKNSGGEPQLDPYQIIYENHPDYVDIFVSLINDCTAEIAGDCRYLPNLSDMFSGQDSFEGYRMELTGIEPEKLVVEHRTISREIQEKKFVPSFTDTVENQYLSDEEKIRVKLQEFGIAVDMKETYQGASIVKFTMKPARGIKMSRFEQHAKDLAIALKASTIRVEAPIMGTDLVGIEVPAKDRKTINWEDKLAIKDTLMLPIGVDVYGEVVRKDLAAMPHLLVAGSTGSGKSVMMNVLIKTLLVQNEADRLGLVLIDPKRVELSQFEDSPHLLTPVVYEVERAQKVLASMVEEMESRYKVLKSRKYRHIDEYNDSNIERMVKIVVVIDEMADLMLQDKEGIIEAMIVRLAQKARAVGIHLILGTQRPSVDVLTGTIKANLPTRICFMTASGIDSRIVLDQTGAEELTGKGDMLFRDPAHRDLKRLQGFYL